MRTEQGTGGRPDRNERLVQMKIMGLFNVSRGASLDRFYILKLFGYGVFIHKIHDSDPFNVFHSHTWNGISFILGSYLEQYLISPGARSPFHRRKWFNRIRSTDFHRTEVDKPIWTLFIHGPKCNKWAIKDFAGREVETPWEGSEGHKDYDDALTKPSS